MLNEEHKKAEDEKNIVVNQLNDKLKRGKEERRYKR